MKLNGIKSKAIALVATMALASMGALALTGCLGTSDANGGAPTETQVEATSTVPEGWTTDTIADMVDFAYPSDYGESGKFNQWTNIHYSANHMNCVAGNYDEAITSGNHALAIFESYFMFKDFLIEPGATEIIEIQGHDAEAMSFAIDRGDDPKLYGRVWVVQIEEGKFVSVMFLGEEENRSNIDKVGESIKILK